MNILECIKKLLTGGALEPTIEEQKRAWKEYAKTIPPEKDDRGRCSMCSKQRVLAHINKMWYDAPVEEVLGGWLTSESFVAFCYPCTRDYLFQGQLRRKEFNEYRD